MDTPKATNARRAGQPRHAKSVCCFTTTTPGARSVQRWSVIARMCGRARDITTRHAQRFSDRTIEVAAIRCRVFRHEAVFPRNTDSFAVSTPYSAWRRRCVSSPYPPCECPLTSYLRANTLLSQRCQPEVVGAYSATQSTSRDCGAFGHAHPDEHHVCC